MADEFYLISQKINDLHKAQDLEWEKHFDWLDEVVRSAKQSRGQPFLPRTPATRGRKRKIRPSVAPSSEDGHIQEEVAKQAEAAVFPQVEIQVEKCQEVYSNNLSVPQNGAVERSSAASKDSGVFEYDAKKGSHGAKRKTRSTSLCTEGNKPLESSHTSESVDVESGIKNLASNEVVTPLIYIEAPPSNETNEDLEELQMPTTTTRTKKIVREEEPQVRDTLQMPPPQFPMSKEIGSRHLEARSSPEKERGNQPASRVDRTKKRAKEVSSEEEMATIPARITRSKKPKTSEMEEKDHADLGMKTDARDADEKLRLSLSESSETESHGPIKNSAVSHSKELIPSRITRSKVKKLVQREAESHVRSPRLNNLGSPCGVRNPHSPSFHKNTAKRIKEAKELSSQVEELSASSVQVLLSPVKIIKHADSVSKSSTMKKLKQGVSYQTPSPSIGMNRHKLLTKAILANSKYSQHRPAVGPSAAFSPQYKMVRTPSDLSRPSNLLLSVGSFVTRVQPTKPSKEEMEERRERDLRLKRERADDSKRKKAELLKQRAEEQKRKNEERMKRVHDKREAKERAVEEVRAQQESERRLKEEKLKEFRDKEEKERKRKLLEARRQEELLRKQKEEEEARIERVRKEEEELAKIKIRLQYERAKREEEEAIRLEELRKEEDQLKLFQMNQKILEQKRATEKAAVELYEQLKEKNRILREKQEMAQINAREAQRKSSHEDQSKDSESCQKENAPLNSTFTKSTPQVTSYEMTPAPLPQPHDPNNYNINDIRSDDSTDEDSKPKKSLPKWAHGNELRKLISMQFSHYGPNKLRLHDTLPPHYLTNKGKIIMDKIFPASELLNKNVELSTMFEKQRATFHMRGSSAQWHTPPYKFFECEGAADSFILPS